MTGVRLLRQSGGAVGTSRPIANKGRLVGIVCRNVADQGTAMFVTYPIADTFTVNLYWRDLEPVRGGSIDLSELDTWDAFASTHNVPRYRVRLFAGKYAPDWAKAINGFTPLPWDSSDQTGGTVGPFWRQDHRDAYYDFAERLAAQMDTEHPLVCEVTDSTVMTTYSEPYLRGFGAMDNAMRQAAIDAGYTYQEDEEAITVEMARQHDLWAPYGISVVHAFNPWGRLLDASTVQWDNTFTMRNLGTYTGMGRFAVSFNTSLGNPVTIRGDNYQDIWEHQNDGWASGEQTMTINKMKGTYLHPDNTPYKTVELAASLGFIDVEVPGGCEDDPDPNYRITPEQAATLSGLLRANVGEGQDPT